MAQTITHITLLVNDYEEAIHFYTQKLNFNLVEDRWVSESKRRVAVAPRKCPLAILLAKASNKEQLIRVGNQTGGRVFFYLHTDSFNEDYQRLVANNVKIIKGPTIEPWGKVAVFEDLYGNQWDLVEPMS